MRTSIAAALTALLLAAPAAGAQPPQEEPDPSIADGSALAALQQAQARWAATGIRSYRFRVRRLCFCPPRITRPATVTVRRGRPVRPPERVEEVATVPRLFGQVREAIDRGVAGLTVVYGARGLPRTIGIDVSRLIADEETTYQAGRLKRLAD